MEVNGVGKLKKILINDKRLDTNKLGSLLEAEIYNLLTNYLVLKKENIILRIDIEDDGNYIIRCKAKSNKIKILGVL